mmetsp:Transcript_2293/g.6730  ORF Transcript_2293/g.6730 Transcript_2293/m.6730 type:complete len:270 (+) Transcript_2293:242-1051(+)
MTCTETTSIARSSRLPLVVHVERDQQRAHPLVGPPHRLPHLGRLAVAHLCSLRRPQLGPELVEEDVSRGEAAEADLEGAPEHPVVVPLEVRLVRRRRHRAQCRAAVRRQPLQQAALKGERAAQPGEGDAGGGVAQHAARLVDPARPLRLEQPSQRRHLRRTAPLAERHPRLCELVQVGEVILDGGGHHRAEDLRHRKVGAEGGDQQLHVHLARPRAVLLVAAASGRHRRLKRPSRRVQDRMRTRRRRRRRPPGRRLRRLRRRRRLLRRR